MPHGTKGGFPVFWRAFGEGPEPAVLLHCALAHSGIWKQVAGHLSDDLTMIAPDMPGHGKTASWDNRCDIFDQVVAIAAGCLGDRCHVIGHSFGAVVALRVAMEQPKKVKTLTLIEPVLFAAAESSDETAFQTYLKTETTFAQALQSGDWETGAKEFTRVWGDGRPWDALSEKEQGAFAKQMHFIRDTEAPLLRDTAALLKEGRLETVPCPTLLIRGSETNPIIPAIHATLQDRIPNATDHVIRGAGHMAPITHPDRVAVLIKRVLGTS